MSRTRAKTQAFKVAEIQERRAARAEERLDAMRRERDQLLKQLHEAHVDCSHMRIAVHEAAERIDRAQAELDIRDEARRHAEQLRSLLDLEQDFRDAAQEGWRLETIRRQEDNARPLWRIAVQRLRAWLEQLCR